MRVLILCCFLLSIASCGSDCGEYERFLSNAGDYQALVSWADNQVFSKSFSSRSFQVGGISWPGLLRFSDDQFGVAPPEWFKDKRYEIRLLDRDDGTGHPKAIFIGKYNSKGIIIFKHGITDISDKDSYIRMTEISRVSNRVALICQRPGD